MNDAEYRAFLDLLMCSDPYPCQGEEILKNLADHEARKRDFEDWIAAYHFFPAFTLDVKIKATGNSPSAVADFFTTRP